MPPKRNTKAPPAATAPSTRSSRSQTKAAAPAAPAETTTPESAKAATVGKRKRTVPEVVPTSDSDSEVVEAPQVKSKTKATPKKKAASSPTKKARITPAPKVVAATKKKAALPFTIKTCEKWFESLEDSGSPGNITLNTIPGWLEELGVSPEGIIFYAIAWVCKAKQTFAISKDEFLFGMTTLGADSNEALLRKLPVTLKDALPLHSSKVFENFYKFCFNYFKPVDVKNLSVDVAQELFTGLLDPARYSMNWTPSGSVEEGGETKGFFPHRKAFVEFLGQSALQVITRDQYEQFIPFNRDVPWNLEGFKEEESTWPTLMDTYIAWRKEKYPLPAAERMNVCEDQY